MSRGHVVAVAAIVAAAAIGYMAGFSTNDPRTVDATPTTSDTASPTASGSLGETDQWLADIADAVTASSLTGMRLAVVSTDGASASLTDQVSQLIVDAGGTVAVQATLGSHWWAPDLATFRAELADQLATSIVGAPDASASVLLNHAIVQALVPGAIPAGSSDSSNSSGDASAPSAGDDGGQVVAEGEGLIVLGDSAPDSAAEVMRTSLERSDIVSFTTPPATQPVDGVVLVMGEGPEGGGLAAARFVAVWEQYAPVSVVVAGTPASARAIPATANDLITGLSEEAVGTRSSVVVATAPVLVGPQVVLALAEQFDGGSGNYGTFDGLATVPKRP